MKSIEEVLDFADSIGLQVVETCDNTAGYPSGIQKAVIGFDNLISAKSFVEVSGKNCEVCLFKIRAGHHFFQNLGTMYRELTYSDYLNDLGDDYRLFDFDQELEAAKENLEYADGTVEDFALIMDIFDCYKREVDTLPDGYVLIYNSDNKELEQCPKTMMSYSEDVYTYTIGVAVRKD